MLRCSLLLLLVACKDPATKPPPAPPAPIVVADAAVSRAPVVRMDKRVELMSIIGRLAALPEYSDSKGTPYLESVERTFAPYAKHAAVTLMRELSAKHGIRYDALMFFAVHLDDSFALQNGAELAVLDKRFTGVDVEALAAAVKTFATDASLDAFRAQHAEYYASLEQTLASVLEKEQPVAWFDAVFGPAEAAFVVVPSPIAGTMNFGPRATITSALHPAGELQLYQVLGVATKTGDITVDEQLMALLVHEMAHSYINPVFEQHAAKLLPPGEKIFALVANQMRAQAYGNAMTMLNEAGVRAVVVNYMREKHGDEAGARTARGEMRRSFLWTNELAEVFRRMPKRDLAAAMPQVIAFFEQLAQSYANGLPPVPFLGPVDAVHQREPVWIVPMGSAYDYARGIATKFSRTVVPASGDALAAQRGKDIVAVGTPADNPVVDFVIRHARWKIAPGQITLGTQTFTGDGLVLIACWFQREAPSRGIVVYAAPRSTDLAGINSVRHGSNDWLVARKQGTGFTVLASGDFPRGLDATWLLPGEEAVTGIEAPRAR